MAIVQNPLISRASGSVGNSIFSKWKSKNTLRSKSINPCPEPTILQAAVRAQFKNCVEFFTPAKFYSAYLFASASSRLSAINSFVKQNVNLFSADSNIIHAAGIVRLIFSRGTIESFFQVSVSPVGYCQSAVGGSYLFGYSLDDSNVRTIVFAVDLFTKQLHVFASAYGSSNAVICNFSPDLIGHDIYYFCVQEDRKKKQSSTSKFIRYLTLS